jgi:hypothetical protein
MYEFMYDIIWKKSWWWLIMIVQLTSHRGFSVSDYIKYYAYLSPSRRREAPCEGTNSPRLFTPGETKALAESKVHQISRAWVTNRGWSSSLISNIWRTVMNSVHWLVQFKICIITTAWRQRNSKLDLMISWFDDDEFFCSHFCKIL